MSHPTCGLARRLWGGAFPTDRTIRMHREQEQLHDGNR
jgi:hypothetical protein